MNTCEYIQDKHTQSHIFFFILLFKIHLSSLPSLVSLLSCFLMYLVTLSYCIFSQDPPEQLLVALHKLAQEFTTKGNNFLLSILSDFFFPKFCSDFEFFITKQSKLEKQ
jgi:hypothetical protein